MNEFHFKECSPQNVVSIKKALKQFRNNTSVVDNYNNLLKDTKTAISNIEQCINSKEELVQRHIRMKEGDVTFLDNVIGTEEKGDNKSRYRAYLALDEKNVVEIRVATHYTTKNTISDKSNNKSQFLLQVVLATPKPVSQEGETIDDTRKVGNLQVITQQRLSSESSIEDLSKILGNIHDFLINPNDSYEKSLLSQNQNNQENKKLNCNRNMKKKLIRLTESDLHRIVKRSVNKVLNEGIGQEQLYSEEELNDAIQVIRKRVYELLSILGKRANVLTYIIDPGKTAIDGGVKDHMDVYDDLIYRNIISRPNLEYDGNYGYTLIDLARMIKNGEL